MECPFDVGFMARFKIQWDVPSRSLREQNEGRRGVCGHHKIQSCNLQLGTPCGDYPVPVFVQEMMALTSQVAESEGRKWKKKTSAREKKRLRMTMSRVNVLTRRDIKTFIRSTQPYGRSRGAKASKVRSCGSSGNQRWRWRFRSSRSCSERRGLWSLCSRSLSLGSESRSRRAGGGTLPVAIWAGAAVVGVVADCNAGF